MRPRRRGAWLHIGEQASWRFGVALPRSASTSRSTGHSTVQARPRAVLVVKLPLPGDRRVWPECSSLRDGGYRLAAITPKGRRSSSIYELHEGVHLYRRTRRSSRPGWISYVWEFIWLLADDAPAGLAPCLGPTVYLKPVQACNPPPGFWLIRWCCSVRWVQSKYSKIARPVCDSRIEVQPAWSPRIAVAWAGSLRRISPHTDRRDGPRAMPGNAPRFPYPRNLDLDGDGSTPVGFIRIELAASTCSGFRCPGLAAAKPRAPPGDRTEPRPTTDRVS